MRHLGYGIAALTILAMLIHAIAGWLGDHPNTEDMWTYAVFADIPATVFLVLGLRGGQYTGWGFLISAFNAGLAAERGLAVHWLYAGAFLLATLLTQGAGMWREGRVLTRRIPPPIE